MRKIPLSNCTDVALMVGEPQQEFVVSTDEGYENCAETEDGAMLAVIVFST